MLCDHLEKAKHYAEHLLSKYPSSIDGYLIKGWLELKDNNLKNARNCFRAVLSQVSSLLGINFHILQILTGCVLVKTFFFLFFLEK